jgi:hypothetical protein
MMHKPILMALLTGAIVLGSVEARATSYNVIDPSVVTGTITTDGTLGVLNGGDITDWHLTLFGSVLVDPANSGFAVVGTSLSATTTQLLFNYTSSDLVIVTFVNGNLQWVGGRPGFAFALIPGSVFAGARQGTQPIAQTPLPAALPLFAGGLGVLGLLGWRKKRNAAIA